MRLSNDSVRERRRRLSGLSLGWAFVAAAFLRRVDTSQAYVKPRQLRWKVCRSIDCNRVAVHYPKNWPGIIGGQIRGGSAGTIERMDTTTPKRLSCSTCSMLWLSTNAASQQLGSRYGPEFKNGSDFDDFLVSD